MSKFLEIIFSSTQPNLLNIGAFRASWIPDHKIASIAHICSLLALKPTTITPTMCNLLTPSVKSSKCQNHFLFTNTNLSTHLPPLTYWNPDHKSPSTASIYSFLLLKSTTITLTISNLSKLTVITYFVHPTQLIDISTPTDILNPRLQKLFLYSYYSQLF